MLSLCELKGTIKISPIKTHWVNFVMAHRKKNLEKTIHRIKKMEIKIVRGLFIFRSKPTKIL